MSYAYDIPDCVRWTHSSLIRDYSTAVHSYRDGINLTIGQPDFPTPERIKLAGIKAIEEDNTYYTDDEGLLELRQAEAAYQKKQNHVSYDPEGEILVTCGATQALDALFRTIGQKGMEVMIPAPAYSGYDPIIRFAGMVPKYFDTSKNAFQVNSEMLDQAYTSFTRCLLLTNPNNPTGVNLSASAMDGIAQWLYRHPDVFVISDEIYAALSFGGSHVSLASYPKLRERVIVISGVSKSYAMTGWRIGFLCAPRDLATQIYKVHQNEISCASSISQYAALEALQSQKEPEEMCREYEKRSRYLYHALRELDIEVIEPSGAFYLFPSIQKFGMTSEQFAKRFLKEKHVGTVPGSAFSQYGEGYIRISTAATMENLKECVVRLHSFIKQLEEEYYGNTADVSESGQNSQQLSKPGLPGSLGIALRSR